MLKNLTSNINLTVPQGEAMSGRRGNGPCPEDMTSDLIPEERGRHVSGEGVGRNTMFWVGEQIFCKSLVPSRTELVCLEHKPCRAGIRTKPISDKEK